MLCSNIKHNLSWTADGRVRPCNHLINFPGSVTVKDMHQTAEYQQLFSDHENNIKSKFCQRCWDKESVDLTSKRQADSKVHNVYSKLNSDYLKIDAAIGDVCNAACRICGPHSSTLWQKIVPSWESSDTISTVWQQAHNRVDDILQLDFGGGEPWANAVPDQLELFKKLADRNRQQLVKIRYNTNGSLWPTRLIEQLKNFREVEITLSIDDIEQRFEYNRWPLKWSQVNENLDKFILLQQQHNNIKLTVNFTVSVFTWQRADYFEKWAKQRGLDLINFNILTNPWMYSIRSLPKDVKKKLPSTKFDNIVSIDPRTDWKEHFLKTTQELDHQRGQSFVDTFTELKDIV